jgi:hypothetical protein
MKAIRSSKTSILTRATWRKSQKTALLETSLDCGRTNTATSEVLNTVERMVVSLTIALETGGIAATPAQDK